MEDKQWIKISTQPKQTYIFADIFLHILSKITSDQGNMAAVLCISYIMYPKTNTCLRKQKTSLWCTKAGGKFQHQIHVHIPVCP